MQSLWGCAYEKRSLGDVNYKITEIYPDSCAYTLHLQRISAATRAGRVIVEMKEKTFRNILDIAKKAGVTRRF
jgi:hypothetical protein